MAVTEWLLLLTQLPATPSSLRVNVWRKLREAGATTLQNGVWILPKSAENSNFMERMLAFIKHNSASAQEFLTQGLNESIQEDIIARFNRDRDEEYNEFLEQCETVIDEIEKESSHGKFSYAELEESEGNVRRLQKWLSKIQKRDFFTAKKSREASQRFKECKRYLQQYTRLVYNQLGIGSTD